MASGPPGDGSTALSPDASNGAPSMTPSVTPRAPIRSTSLAPLVRLVATSAMGAVRRLLSDRTPLVRVALAIAGGSILVAMAVAQLDSRASEERGSEAALAAASAGEALASQARTDDDAVDASDVAVDDASPVRQPRWRVARLADEGGVTLTDGTIGRRPLLTALASAGLPPGEAQRVARSLADVRDVESFAPKDTFTVARDKATGRVIAYEIASSPSEVWQAREEDQTGTGPKLIARRLGLATESVRVYKSVLVGPDLRASFVEAGLTPVDDILTLLDDALEGHAELSDLRAGARLRIAATAEYVDGAFVRWVGLDAVEYLPATPNAAAVRVYWFDDGAHRGWYDAKGRKPARGGFRAPLPFTRIVSRFNPHRMHPVLHVVMPHNGVDFAAPVGAKVYATAPGIVTSAGFDGACGNKVEIAHAGGVTSVYCHLSRFAQGLRVGEHVESRQLVAYVGQTGRVTGPHLHFGIRRAGVFIDPLSLRLDGFHTVPRSRRDEFDRRRAELDVELDGIALAPLVGSAPEAAEGEVIYEVP
jgi:murein DD-endopeptidase MepM/ murein hydrolase activator NlpD